jgi:hypothetical protein
MGEALNKYEDESNKTVAREEILEYLAFSTFKQGRIHFKSLTPNLLGDPFSI